MNTIKHLRSNGAQVKVRHKRYSKFQKDDNLYYNSDLAGIYRAPKGGETIVEVTLNGKKATGVAHCSRQDPYNRHVGLAIAIKRAMVNFKNAKNI